MGHMNRQLNVGLGRADDTVRRGEPYMVCFDPVTYTNSNGEEITVESDCVIITPN